MLYDTILLLTSVSAIAPVKETHGVGRSSSRKLSALLPPPRRLPLAFVGQAVTNRIANATYVLDLGLQRPAVLANSNFVILQPFSPAREQRKLASQAAP